MSDPSGRGITGMASSSRHNSGAVWEIRAMFTVWQREQAEAATGAEAALEICWENWPGSRAAAGTFVVLRFGQQLQYMFY